MFGSHAEAQQFHTVLDAVHQGHRDELHRHHTTFTDLASDTLTAKRLFTDTDESGAAGLNSAAAAFDG